MILARTPEVFQSQHELPVVRADFARQLERELIAATTPTAEQIEACAREIQAAWDEYYELSGHKKAPSVPDYCAILTRHFNPTKK